MTDTITTQDAMKLLQCSRMTFYRYALRYGFTSPSNEHKGGRAKQQLWYITKIKELADALKVTRGK